MSDLAFYNIEGQPRGLRRLVVPVRRLLRRILRPIFQRQVQIFQDLCDRLDALETDQRAQDRRQDVLLAKIQATSAMGWDHVAMARRLAVLEDRVEALLGESSRESATSRPAVASSGWAKVG